MATSFPTAMILVMLFIHIVNHRQHLFEKKRYQLMARKKLKISAAERRTIISHTRAALVIVTPLGEIESFNPTAEHYFGYTEGELKGQNLSQLLPPAGRKGLEKGLWPPGRGPRGEYQIETQGRRRDGSLFPIDLIASEIQLPRGLRFIITIHEISRLKAAEQMLRCALEEQEQRISERTAELRSSNQQLLNEVAERKQAEKVLKETQEDLIQASKLAALGQMSAGVVHELNQPLTAIRTFTASSRLLLERNELGQVEENLTRTIQLTERMAKMTSQLKIFARKSGGEKKNISLKAALDQALALFEERICRDQVRVRLNLPTGLLPIGGDHLRLEQVLINLVGNAMDAMDKIKDPQLEIEATSGPEGLSLSICDNGPGIAEEHLAHLFEPFFTTKEVGAGLGLGLSISYGIIKDLGGTIRGENRPEGGAQFVIELPTTAKGQARG